jgi:hypothetical protein
LPKDEEVDMTGFSYKQALRESGHLTLTWRESTENLDFAEKMAYFGFAGTIDSFLVRSDDAPRRQRKIVSTGAQFIEDGIFKVNEISKENLATFERAKWILCVRLQSDSQITKLFECSETQYLLSNFVPPGQLVKKLIRNFSGYTPNSFVLFNPAWPGEFTIVGNDSLFDFVVSNAQENFDFQAARGYITHCRESRKTLFPSRLRSEDRIDAINPAKSKVKKKAPIESVGENSIPNEDDIRKISLSSTLVGSSWFFDSANVAHLNFYSKREVLKETQELLEHLEEVESSDGLDGEKAIAIGQFLQSGDRIALMLTGPHAGSIVMFFHDVDDQIISPNLTQFVEQLNADNSLLKRFGVAKFNRSGKLIDPYKL